MNNTDHGTLVNAAEVRFVRLLPGPIERVWEFLTDPDKRRLWFAGGTNDKRVGGKTKLIFDNKTLADPAEAVPEKYQEHATKVFEGIETITRHEPPHVFAHTWGEEDGQASEVTFELTSEGDKVRLVLTHRRVDELKQVIDVSGGWHIHLTVLISILEGSEQPPFWTTLERLEREYAERFGPA
ncbi:MAG: SRPBCC family protein [Prosthecobacter sp.]